MDAATGSWAAEAWMMWEAGSKGGKLGLQAVAHARILLGERPALKKSSHRERGLGGNLRDRARPPEHGVPEVETRQRNQSSGFLKNLCTTIGLECCVLMLLIVA